MSEYITLLSGDVTIAQTIIALGGLAIFGAVAYLFFVFAKAYKTVLEATQARMDAKTAYCEMVYAFKSGLIKQGAESENVELIYPKPTEEKSLVHAIKEDVKEDVKNI